MRRLPALLLAVLLAVGAVLPGFAQEAWQFSLHAQLSCTPEQPALQAIADLMNAASFTGSWVEKDGSFELRAAVEMEGYPRSRTGFTLQGVDSHWSLSSPLLGSTKLMFNNQAMIEFGLKVYHHLGIPLHWLTWLYPYVHREAWTAPVAAWEEIVGPNLRKGHIPTGDLIFLLYAWEDLRQRDRSFSVWMESLDEAAGINAFLDENLQYLPVLLTVLLPDGIDVVLNEQGETWLISGKPEAPPLLQRSADGNAAQLNIPVSLDGGMVTARFERTPEETLLSLALDAYGETLDLSARYEAAGETLVVRLSGSCLPEALLLPVRTAEGRLALVSPGSPDETDEAAWQLSIRKESGNTWGFSSGADPTPWLHLQFSREDFRPDSWPAWHAAELEGVNFYSLNDTSLEEFVRAVLPSAITNGIPLAAALPASTVAWVMDELEEIGLLTLEP